MKVDRYDVGAFTGLGVICFGIWLVWAPLGVVALGGLIIGITCAADDAAKKKAAEAKKEE